MRMAACAYCAIMFNVPSRSVDGAAVGGLGHVRAVVGVGGSTSRWTGKDGNMREKIKRHEQDCKRLFLRQHERSPGPSANKLPGTKRGCSSETRRQAAVGRRLQPACVGEDRVQGRRIASSTELRSRRELKEGSSESLLGSNWACRHRAARKASYSSRILSGGATTYVSSREEKMASPSCRWAFAESELLCQGIHGRHQRVFLLTTLALSDKVAAA